jgi:predicted dehydrogenase
LIDAGYLGQLRQVQVIGLNAALADESASLHWRQDAALSGVNVLILGILHETLLRWAPPPVRVLAQSHSFIPERVDAGTGQRRPVGTPDCVQVLATLQGGARAVYHLGGTLPFGQEQSITLYGRAGVLHYDLAADRLLGASGSEGMSSARREEMHEIAIPPEKEEGWRVEADFVESIRQGKPVRLTDFATGVHYMGFTEAVAKSAASGCAVDLPLP